MKKYGERFSSGKKYKNIPRNAIAVAMMKRYSQVITTHPDRRERRRLEDDYEWDASEFDEDDVK
jgi:hypothetical protein